MSHGYTNGPNLTPFRYHTTDTLLTIERGNGFNIETIFIGDDIINSLTSLRGEFGNEFFDLANSVATVGMENSPRGLGRTIFESNGDTSQAQASSQLAPLLYHAGVFQWNGVAMGAMYSLINLPKDWPELRALIDAVEWPQPE